MPKATTKNHDHPTNNAVSVLLLDLCSSNDLSIDLRESLASAALEEWPHLKNDYYTRWPEHGARIKALRDRVLTDTLAEITKSVLDIMSDLPTPMKDNMRRSLAEATDRSKMLVKLDRFASQLLVGNDSEAREEARKALLAGRHASQPPR